MLGAVSKRRRHPRATARAERGLTAPWLSAGAFPAFSPLERLEDRLLMSIDPTASEQLMLELVNRMRMDPAGELARLTSSLGTQATSTDPDVNAALDFFNVHGPTLAAQWATLAAAPPLAWNEALIGVAEAHNNAMIAADVQSHEAPGEPPIASGGLRTRFNNQGYSSQSSIGENIFAFSESVFHGYAGLAIDWGGSAATGGIQSPPGHRQSIMNPAFREVGIRITPEGSAATDVGPLVITQDFGGVVNPTPQPILLGVTFNDADGDVFYDLGEGLGGVNVNILGIDGTPGNFNLTSMTAGGWQLAVPAGTYRVTFSGGGLAQPLVKDDIVVGTSNVKVDSVFAEIDVQGNSLSIADGDATPSAADHTDFGNADVTGGTVVRTFTIANLGTTALGLTGTPRVSISGTHAADFTVTTQPATASIGGGGSTAFVVTFNPSALGARSATIEVQSDDEDESTYSFAVQGAGTQQPEIDVRGNAVSIVDGDVTPAAADHTSFANVNISAATRTRTYTIHNTGTAALNLTAAPIVQIIGTNAGDFTVTVQPPASIAPGGSANFEVTFDPSATGARTATIRIASDDADESLYDFAISGVGVAPEIDVQGNATSIADGDSTPRTQDFTDFRQAPVTGTLTSVTRTFTIRNTAATELSLTGAPLVQISGAHAADFTVTTQPASSTVAVAGSVTFVVTFNPSAAGLRTATVTIANDDADEGSYDFAIQGSGIVATTGGGGLQSATLQEGAGAGAVSGQGLSVIYTGYLTTGAQFDSNVGGTPFSLTLGVSNVIQGWHQGLVGIKIGEKRTLVIPPALAYGNTPPNGSGIPAGATLIFEIERVAPDISLGSPQGTVIPIASGDVTPSTADHTDMGPAALGGGAAQWSFRITTTGALNLTGNPRVKIAGADAGAFTIATQPTTPIVPGSGQATATRDFTIAFNPTKLGLHSATVSIASDDADETPYTFDIQGTGIANRISGAVEDTDFVVTHAMLNAAMRESGTSQYRVESVTTGQLFKGGVAVVPGVTTLASGQTLTWRAPANINRTQDAFTVKVFDGTNTVGDAQQIRIEVTPTEDNPVGAINDIVLGNGSNKVVNLASLFSDADITGTVARITTSLGAVDVHLFDGRTPLTVANFLKYASEGDYANTIIHRVVQGFIVQGGGFRPQLPASHIATDPAVANEFGISSLRGTIAMAKTGNVIDSATSEWFFNLDDNSANLDNQNGGFTVFGEVIGNGMAVVDDIALTPLFTDGQTFTSLPLRNYSGGAVQDSHWIKTTTVAIVSPLAFSIVGNTNAALVTPTITNGSLNLVIPEGVAGSSDVTVRITDLTGRVIEETFTVTVVGVSVEAVDEQAAEPAGGQPANPGVFRITRAGPLTEDLTVNYTIGGSAQHGIDFESVPLSAIIPAGQSFIDVTITPLEDAEAEGTETAVLTITATDEFTISGTGTATVSILDDVPVIAVTALDAAAAETTAAQAANTGAFQITRSGDLTDPLTVHYTITGTAANGIDVTVISTSVEIPANQSTVNVLVTPTDDAISEATETVALTLSDNAAYVVDTQNQATVTVADNDAVRLQIAVTDASLAEGAPANPGAVRISRTGSLAAPLAVKFTRGGKAAFGPAGDYTMSVNGTNHTATTVTIPAGEAFIDIDLNVIDDAKPDVNETLLITLAAGAGYALPALVADRTATLNITDNEPVVSIASLGFTGADAAAAETNQGEAGNRAFFRIFRTGSTAAPLAVKFTKAGTAKAADYLLSVNGFLVPSTTVTIPAGADHVDVFVEPLNDQLVEAGETVILKLAASPAAYTPDADAADVTATATLADNEPFVSVSVVGFTGADAAAAETHPGETANTARFRISRGSGGPALPVNIKLTGTAKRGNSSDYVIVVGGQLVTSGTVVIPNGATFVDVIVSPNNDATPEVGAAETVILTLGKATTAYKLDPDAADLTAQVTIADNEPVISVVAIDPTAAEPGGDPNTGKFRITRTGSTATSLEVTYKITGTATAGKDYVSLGGKVTFVIGASFIDLDVQPLVDALVEVPELVTLALTAGKTYSVDAAAKAATVTIADGVAAAGPDLVILAESNAAKAFRVGSVNTPMTISATVKNQGNAATGAASQMRVLLSRDRTVSGSDLVLGTFNLNSLAAGATVNVSGSFNVTSLGLQPVDIGDYYVLLVADINGTVAEAIESNNTFAGLLANVKILGPI